MLTLPVYNKEGEEVGNVKLPKEIFGLEVNNDLLYQVINIQFANRRTHFAKTKDRSEVKGGGKKPWRQKGTGRARHGSIRSPLWVGGGVTFGPNTDKVFERKINKKAKRKALFMVLSSKVKDKEMIVLDDLKTEAKTRSMADLLKKTVKNEKKHTILIITAKKDENTFNAAKNITYTKTLAADSLNVLDLLAFKYLLLDKEAIKVIEKTYSHKAKTQNVAAK